MRRPASGRARQLRPLPTATHQVLLPVALQQIVGWLIHSVVSRSLKDLPSLAGLAHQLMIGMFVDDVPEEIDGVFLCRAPLVSGRRLLWRYPARHALGPIINSLGFDLNRVFNELPIVAVILTLTEAGALLLEALARSNDQQLAGAIIFLLTASIVFLNFVTDILLAIMDPRVRRGLMG